MIVVETHISFVQYSCEIVWIRIVLVGKKLFEYVWTTRCFENSAIGSWISRTHARESDTTTGHALHLRQGQLCLATARGDPLTVATLLTPWRRRRRLQICTVSEDRRSGKHWWHAQRHRFHVCFATKSRTCSRDSFFLSKYICPGSSFTLESHSHSSRLFWHDLQPSRWR